MNDTEPKDTSTVEGVSRYANTMDVTYHGNGKTAVMTSPVREQSYRGSVVNAPNFRVTLRTGEKWWTRGSWLNSLRLDFSKFDDAEAIAYTWAQFAGDVTAFDNGGATADRYTVEIGDTLYLMSKDANMPNGVCMYYGEAGSIDPVDSEQVQLGQLPAGTVHQIMYLIGQQIQESESC